MLSEKELAYLRNPNSIDSNHRSMYESRIEEKANDSLVSLLNVFPELVEYVNKDTEEQLQAEVTPLVLGQAIGQLFPADQLPHIAAGFAWSQKGPEESNEEFRNRLPSLLEEFEKKMHAITIGTRHNVALAKFIGRIKSGLLERIQDEVDRRRTKNNINMIIPATEITRWVTTRDNIDGASHLQQLLDDLPPPWDTNIQETLSKCELTIIGVIAPQSGAGMPQAEDWALALPPSQDDYDRWMEAIERLNPEIERIVDQYWTENQIRKRDRLLNEAFATLNNFTEHDKEILQWDDRANNRPEWTRHHTRRANILTDNRTPPLLTRTEESHNYKEWELTAFGEFVRWLHEEGYEQTEIERDGFPVNAPDEIVVKAIEMLTEINR